MKNVFWLIILVLANAGAFGQKTYKIGVVCKSGKPFYQSRESGQTSFASCIMPTSAKLVLHAGDVVEIHQLIYNSPTAIGYAIGKRTTLSGKTGGNHELSYTQLLNHIENARNGNDLGGFIKQFYHDLFSTRSKPDTQQGDQGGTKRGGDCPLVKMVSFDSESLFLSDSIHLAWTPDESGNGFALQFFGNNGNKAVPLWETFQVQDSVFQGKLPADIFQPGEIYHYSVAKKDGAVACPKRSFRILMPDEVAEVGSVWEQFIKNEPFQTPLKEVLKAEYMASNGLFFEADRLYQSLSSYYKNYPDLLSMKQRFDERMTGK
jgi:hypothetical protein